MILNSRNLFLILFIFLGYLGTAFMGICLNAQELSVLQKQDVIIVDVRSATEFYTDSNPNSINIPLDELNSRLATLDKDKTIIVCCASGRRSAIAASILKHNDFKNVIDAGSWRNTLE